MLPLFRARLYAVVRGERRRNLDGSEAELPTEEARQDACL
jgi:hypothetical protein